MRGATDIVDLSADLKEISIHAPHAGCDGSRPRSCTGSRQFQSTHPMRGATLLGFGHLPKNSISIHAPHAGCDAGNTPRYVVANYFNPRTPCGVRHPPSPSDTVTLSFQSTHPMRGATRNAAKLYRDKQISIHAPHAGCDLYIAYQFLRATKFQSTHPMRGATSKSLRLLPYKWISIHAPHAGCDTIDIRFRDLLHISIHAPHAGCDINVFIYYIILHISIHAPHAGCDKQ